MTGGAVEGDTLAAVFGPDDPEFEQAALDRFRAERRHALEGIFAMGEILLEVRQQLKHGRWMAWLDRAGVNDRSARKLMSIAQDSKLLDWRFDPGRAQLLPPVQETLYQLAALNDRDFDTLAGAGKIHPEMRRGEIRPALAVLAHGAEPNGETPLAALPDGKYRAILADPPWRFETHGPDGRGRAPDKHYPTMALADIEMLPVMTLAADDAALFLWITSDMLPHAPRIMIQWGFEYKSTAFVWVKEGAPGLGYWTRKQTEICLLGTRGSPKRKDKGVPEALYAARGRHSEKPAETYDRIMRLVAGPYIELFARQAVKGWDCWGNDPALAKADA